MCWCYGDGDDAECECGSEGSPPSPEYSPSSPAYTLTSPAYAPFDYLSESESEFESHEVVKTNKRDREGEESEAFSVKRRQIRNSRN